MSFTFGAPSSAPSPAPSTGGFNFGSSNPAPATPAFGATPATAAAPPTFGSFAPAPTAPAPGAFSSTPAPLFGSTPAPAFGAAPTPAFGATPAPAPFSFGGASAPPTGFGSTATPAFGGYGSTTAPSFGGFGSPPAQLSQAVAPAISGNTPYAALSPDEKKAVDALHEAIMNHKRTMVHVETISPRLLSSAPKVAADSAGGDDSPISLQIVRLEARASKLQQLILTTRKHVEELTKYYEKSATQAIMHGKWPLEATAGRRGVSLAKSRLASEDNVHSKLQQLLDRQLAHVDRVERMPSPYLWQIVEDLEARLSTIQNNVETLSRQLERYRSNPPDQVDVVFVIQLQHRALCSALEIANKIHQQMEIIRQRYRLLEKRDNVLDKADQEERERERRVQEQVRIAFLQASSKPPQTTTATTTAAPTPTPLGGNAPPPTFASAPTGLFGSTPPSSAPTPSFFGSTTAAPTPGGLFGNTTPAPAPPTFGAPAATPAPVFGAPAPSTGLFGAAPAAPAAFPNFSATSSTPKTKNKSSRSTRRR